MSTSPASTAPPPSMAQRLGAAHVDLRPDLQVFRHVFRNQPCYVVRDPTSMQSHRFSSEDYRILIRISSVRSLAETFDTLVTQGFLKQEDEDEFYQFVVTLHNLAFLSLPVTDDRVLYRRFLAKQRARRMGHVLGFLSLRIPLWNPDDFLDRTLRRVRWLYGRAAFSVWSVVMIAALAFVAGNWRELVHPRHSILEVGNLPVLWVTLIVLKILHEFGHAYACKIRGGTVPEMGVMLILLTPMTYVDATAAWGFVRRRDRIVVSLAGMYIESILAACALAVWATTPSPVVRILAHNVMLLASVVTIALNANPLMRFDGYYVLSDLVEIPNLRAHAEHCVRSLLKEVCFGIEDPVPETSRRLRLALCVFGVASAIYRATLVLSVSMVVATKAFLLGMAFAVGYVGNQLLRLAHGLIQYLGHSPETEPFRRRAVAIGAVVLVGLPLLAIVVPVPDSVRAPGLVVREDETVVRAEHAGFLGSVPVREGDSVEPGTLLVELENPLLHAALAEAEASLEVASLRAAAYRADQSSRVVPEERKVEARRLQLSERKRELESLQIRSGGSGVVVHALSPTDLGRFVQKGEPVARVGSGSWTLRVLLSEHDFAAARPSLGERVRVRVVGDPWRTLEGEILRVTPAGSKVISRPSLTQLGGGEIPVEGKGLEASEAYFEVTVRLPGDAASELRDGMRGQAALEGKSEPLALGLLRRLLRAGNRILQG